MLGVARRGSEGEFHVRKNEWIGWRPTHMMGTKVTGKTLGLIGMGRIAQAMAYKSHFGFNMKIIFFDPYFENEDIIKKFNATKLNSIDEVLSEADFVSLHCPSTKETKGLINKQTISKMKPSAYLINTARGDIVNENELVEALKENKIMGAGLDVYEKEPEVQKDLVQLKKCIFLLPHLEARLQKPEKWVLEYLKISMHSSTTKNQWTELFNNNLKNLSSKRSIPEQLLEIFKYGVSSVQPTNILDKFIKISKTKINSRKSKKKIYSKINKVFLICIGKASVDMAKKRLKIF